LAYKLLWNANKYRLYRSLEWYTLTTEWRRLTWCYQHLYATA